MAIFGSTSSGSTSPATSSSLGTVKITGTPTDAAAPTSPVLESGGLLPASVIPPSAKIQSVSSLPTTSTVGEVFFLTSDGTFHIATAVNTISQVYVANSQTSLSINGTAGTGGVTANKLVKVDTDGRFVAVSGTESIFGVAQNTAIADGGVVVTTIGASQTVAEGTWTAGNYLIAGTTDPTAAKDAGTSALSSIPSTTRVLGKANEAATDGQTKSATLIGPHRFGAQSSGGGAALTANTFTATQTINPAANTSALVTSGSLTGSDATPFLSPAGTWNTSGTPSAIKLNVTDTASNVGSALLDLQVGSVSKFFVRKDGTLFTGPITTSSSIDASANGSVTIGSAGEYKWSTRSRVTSPADGEILVTAGNQTSAASLSGLSRKVTAKTANYSVAVLDSNVFFTNTGASGAVNFTLPTAVAGVQYTFYVAAAQTFTITAAASTTIRIAGTASASAGNITSNVIGNAITLTAISTTSWASTSHEGTWTIN